MLKLATPISSLFKDRQAAERIIRASDCLEYRNGDGKYRYPRQQLAHFAANIIHKWDKEERDIISSTILSKQDLELVTFHMTSAYKDAKIKNGMFQPFGRAYSRPELLSNARNNIKWLRSFLKKRVLIGVENNNYYPTPAYRYISEGDFITQIVRDNHIRLLFDVAHARITALNKKIDYSEYRLSLPMDEIIQLHIAKYAVNKGGLAYDAHLLPDKPMFKEVRELTRQYPVKYLTIEYYKDTDKLLGVLDDYRKIRS